MKNLLVLSVIGAMISINVIFAQETKNVFMYKLENIEVHLLSEGQQTGNTGILIGATPEMIKKAIPEGSFTSATNAFLVKIPGKNILIDTGFGRNLFDNLKTIGLSAEQIDAVLITHMHGDHIGGLIKEGKATFPNAALYIAKLEHDYWTSNEEMNKVPENRRGGFESAKNVVNAYKERLHLFTPDELGKETTVLFPGVQGIENYGHTPGHTVFMIGTGDQKMLIWGDMTHVLPVQMMFPELAVTYDVNPEQAVISRKKMLEYVEKKNIPVAGMHIEFPGMGKIKANSEKGYIFTLLCL